MHKAKDLFKDLDEDKAANKCVEIAKWLEALPISNLDFVEMGFDSMAADLIDKLD